MTEKTRPAPCQGKTGPAEGTPSKTSSIAQPKTTTDSSAPPHRVVPLPLRWAKNLVDGAIGPVPEYGSVEWAALPDEAREKVAGCVLAAEQWRTRHHRQHLSDIRPRTRRSREIAEARRPRPGDHMGGPVQFDRATSGE